MPVINHQTIPEVLMRPGIRGQFLAHYYCERNLKGSTPLRFL